MYVGFLKLFFWTNFFLSRTERLLSARAHLPGNFLPVPGGGGGGGGGRRCSLKWVDPGEAHLAHYRTECLEKLQ